ncbi:MAG: putative toxin-antitoxin system toxin component, PIN family [Ginsengibacter sp.]
MGKNNIAIILDTNWYISYLIKKSDSRLSLILSDERIEIIANQKLIEELRIKIRDKKFRKYFTVGEAIRFIELIKEVATICIPTSSVTICRDSKDNFLLALAKDAHADFLITGDKDLLVLKEFENTSILTLTEFLSLLNKK